MASEGPAAAVAQRGRKEFHAPWEKAQAVAGVGTEMAEETTSEVAFSSINSFSPAAVGADSVTESVRRSEKSVELVGIGLEQQGAGGVACLVEALPRLEASDLSVQSARTCDGLLSTGDSFSDEEVVGTDELPPT